MKIRNKNILMRNSSPTELIFFEEGTPLYRQTCCHSQCVCVCVCVRARARVYIKYNNFCLGLYTGRVTELKQGDSRCDEVTYFMRQNTSDWQLPIELHFWVLEPNKLWTKKKTGRKPDFEVLRASTDWNLPHLSMSVKVLVEARLCCDLSNTTAPTQQATCRPDTLYSPFTLEYFLM
jgi:hypothetical protein